MENILRITGYLILTFINAIMYYFLHSHFYFTLLVIMLTAPVISIGICFFLKKSLEVTVSSSDIFIIKLINKTPFVSLDAKVLINVENSLFKTSGDMITEVPIRALSGYEFEIPIASDYPGIIKITVKSVKIKDLMGFVNFSKSFDTGAETTVLPRLYQEVAYDMTALDQGSVESEESSKKGHDFSDVQEIREYIPGDKLMSIHWKLSAKRDVLMVKDRVTMSDKQLVVLPELCIDKRENLDVILSTAYTLIYRLINDKTTVRLLYWCSERYEYEDVRIDYPEELKAAFERMLYEQPYLSMDEAAVNMSAVYPELKAYLHITAQEGKAYVTVRENG